MKRFIFIIPKTPANLQDNTRRKLWILCVNSLLQQTYSNWLALVVGRKQLESETDPRFIEIDFEGRKEEKLQKATEYIIQTKLPGEYIIRLDDDDIINPNILAKAAKIDFDLYVDKHQWFWHYESGRISNKVWYWFPNTCIHKRIHALSPWGDFAKGNFKKFKDQALLIENDHSLIHNYYKNKNVILASKKHPIYLRSITNSSITSKNASDFENYLSRFGVWSNNRLCDFTNPMLMSPKIKNSQPKVLYRRKVQEYLLNLRYSLAYTKIMHHKNRF